MRMVVVILAFLPLLSLSQIKGKVSDRDSGKGIPFVNIQSLRTGIGTSSDENGNFAIDVMLPDTLVFSIIGYEERRVKATSDFMDIYMQTTPLPLGEVSVIAFALEATLFEQSAPVARIDLPWNDGSFDPQRLIEINKIPGVQFEERSPGSYRLNIRGSSIRSPFDVRNVKVYWNGIPYTEPGGSSPFNLLEPSFFGEVEIIKGPSSSMYGAGNGGVMLIRSRIPKPGEISASTSRGSFGTNRYDLSLGFGSEKAKHGLMTSIHNSDGFRSQSHLKRSNFEYSGKYDLPQRQYMELNILYTDLEYGIPGGLNLAQFNADPSQARPGTAFTLGSEEANAGVSSKNLISSARYSLYRNDLIVSSSVYSVLTDFENPFILDYKREAQMGAGTRNELSYSKDLGLIYATYSAGMEFQTRYARAGNYGNVGGNPDTLNFDDEIRTRTSLAFLQSQFELGTFSLVLGAGISSLSYDVYRLWDASLLTSYRIIQNFSPVLSPRVVLKWTRDSRFVTFINMGTGYSPPTLEEFRTNEGSLNEDLDAEKGLNLEWVSRLKFHEYWSAELDVFKLALDGTIVSYPSDRGTALFRNAGSTSQYGVETTLRYQPPSVNFRILPEFSLSHTFHDFRFVNYEVNGVDFSGKYLPGIARNSGSANLELTDRSGAYLKLFTLFKGKIPLVNDNTVSAENFTLINTTLGLKKKVRIRYFEPTNLINTSDLIHLFFSINNLTNVIYSLGNDINAFGGRYFQPALPRNYSFGFRYEFNSIKK